MNEVMKDIQGVYTAIQLLEEATFGIKQGYELENADYITEHDKKVILGVERTKLNHALRLANDRIYNLLEQIKE